MHCENTRQRPNSPDKTIPVRKETTYGTTPQPVVTKSLCPSLSVTIMPFRQFIRRLLGRNEQGPRRTTRRDGNIISTFVGGPSEPRRNPTFPDTEVGEEFSGHRWFSANPTGWWEQRLGDNNDIYDWRPGVWPALNPDRGAHRGSPVYSRRRLQGVRLTAVNYIGIEDIGFRDTRPSGNQHAGVVAWERNFQLHDSNFRLTGGNRLRREDIRYVIDLRTEHEANIPPQLLLGALLAAIQDERASRLLLPENNAHIPQDTPINVYW